MNERWDALQTLLKPTLPDGWGLLAIAMGAVGLLWLTLRIRAWFRDDADGEDRPGDLLLDMRELHRQGGLSDEEFRLITSRLIVTAKTPVRIATRLPAATSAAQPTAAKPAGAEDSASMSASLQGRSDMPDQDDAGPSS